MSDEPLSPEQVWRDWVEEYQLKEGEVVVFGGCSNGDDARSPVWWCESCGALFSVTPEHGDPPMLYVDRRSFDFDESCRCDLLVGAWDTNRMETT